MLGIPRTKVVPRKLFSSLFLRTIFYYKGVKQMDLYEKLNEYGILQFVRSGAVAITKQPMNISEILSDFKN